MKTMPISRLNSIPRFALPYTPGDFVSGFFAMFRKVPRPDAFEFLPEGPKLWTRSGRQALRYLLESLSLKLGSGVAVPLFTDPSLFRAIVAAGLRPVFIDVDPRYLTIDPQWLEHARGTYSAVVAVHLFGQMADMPAILDAAGSVPVIEDACHAPLSYLNDQVAGSFGVGSFYSFASTKYWPAGGGGLAALNDPSFAPKLSTLIRSLAPPSRLKELRNLFLQAAKAIVFQRRLYGICGRPLRRWVEDWALLEPCLDLEAIQRSWAAVARRQARRMRQRVQRQRENSLRLLSHLGDLEGVGLPIERPGALYNYHIFPVLLRNAEERTAMMDAMWTKFVDTSKIYSVVVSEARRFGYQGGCPIAELVADRLITLPNYANLTGPDIDYVADVFLSSLHAWRTTEHKPEPVTSAGQPAFTFLRDL
jgi:dTDP-4-amino-4,6-dideoxygalactose transaminase